MKATRPPFARHSKRPFYRRLSLHPVTMLLVLCAGVLVVAATFSGHAVSYDITATVPAEPVTSPAIITSPSFNQHVFTPLVTVTGTCPDQAYVKLFRNNMLSSVAPCNSSSFLAHATLDAGSNQLQAKVYNTTDNEGPSSSPVTVHYDVTTTTPQTPPEVPTTLRIATLDTATYRQNTIPATSSRPTISGYAPPYSTIVITFHSKVLTCRTQANGDGWWTCTLDQDLDAGIHSIDVVAITPEGKTITFPTTRILVNLAAAPLLKQPTIKTPLTLVHNYRHQIRFPQEMWQWDFQINGGVPPYQATITWNDGAVTTTDAGHKSSLTVRHAFAAAGSYRPNIRLTDSGGNSTAFELLASVKAPPSVAAPSIVTDIQSYLWIIWPAYITILLMIISFWLGEREIVQRMLTRSTRKKRSVLRK